jgi:Domain of Unknown Function (DUF1206)
MPEGIEATMSTAVDHAGSVVPGASHGAKKAQSGATKVARGADDLRRSTGFRWMARVGLLSRALVYCLVGALVIEIAIKGRASSSANSEGAFAEIAKQPTGHEILGLVCAGLAAYALWRFVEAVSMRPQGESKSGWARLGWACIGVVYVFLCVDVVELITGSSTNSPDQHPASFAAGILRLPLGPELLGLIAAGVAVGGGGLIVWGLTHDYSKDLKARQKISMGIRTTHVTGVVGNVARGIAVLLVASSFFTSVVSGDPMRAKSLDAALRSLSRTQTGLPVLVIVGIGLVAFAVYSALEAWLRQV